MHIRNKIEAYFELALEIHRYFGYKEDWRCIPMENQLDQHWFITGKGDDSSDKCVYCPEPFTEAVIEAGQIYGGTIYTQRFLPKWVYRGKELTMVSVDTHTDGNKFLYIFDNEKECKDEFIKKLYMDKWGSI